MKKIIIVLLITVLVAGFAFADLVKPGTLTGSAGISFFVDLNDQDGAKHEWGFKNTTSAKYSFKFEFDSTKVAIGEDHQTDVWAELAAEASAWISLSNAPIANGGDVAAKYTAKITKANIHVGEITFGILNAGSAIDLAAHYALDANGDPIFDVVYGDAFVAEGFTVSYKDWNGGFGAKGDWKTEDTHDDNIYEIFAHVETPTFKFADDQVSVLGGAYAYVTDKNTNASQFGGAAMAAYEADKLAVDAEVDLAYFGAAEKFAFEAAANATYDFVTLNVYLAPGAFFGYADEDPLKLDAKLSAKYTFNLNEDIALAVTGWVDARDTLVKALSLEIGSTQKTTIDAFAIELSEVATLKNLANADVDTKVELTASEKVTYTHEKFTAYEKLTAKFDFSADEALKSLAFEAGISSKAIIEGATLALVYNKVDFVKFSANRGLVTASCTINF